MIPSRWKICSNKLITKIVFAWTARYFHTKFSMWITSSSSSWWCSGCCCSCRGCCGCCCGRCCTTSTGCLDRSYFSITRGTRRLTTDIEIKRIGLTWIRTVNAVTIRQLPNNLLTANSIIAISWETYGGASRAGITKISCWRRECRRRSLSSTYSYFWYAKSYSPPDPWTWPEYSIFFRAGRAQTESLWSGIEPSACQKRNLRV